MAVRFALVVLAGVYGRRSWALREGGSVAGCLVSCGRGGWGRGGGGCRVTALLAVFWLGGGVRVCDGVAAPCLGGFAG